MPRRGRPSEENEERIKRVILDLVPTDAPGVRFNHLVTEAEKYGISGPTVWRHIRRQAQHGIIVHEGKFYRKSLLHQIMPDRFQDINVSSEPHSAGICGGGLIFDQAKIDRLRNVWSTSWRGKMIGPLDHNVLFAMDIAIADYLNLLDTVLNAPNLASAGDAANTLMDSNVKWPLMILARLVWDSKEKFELQKLDKKQIEISVSAPIDSEDVQRKIAASRS